VKLPGRPAIMANIIIDLDKCTGCGICMLACSERKTETYRPSISRIRVFRQELPNLVKVVHCYQCNNAPCASSCPVKAISLNEDNVWIVDESICIGCGKCVEACPFGAMFLNEEHNVAYKCDLCGGNPECVLQCPKDALSIRSNKK